MLAQEDENGVERAIYYLSRVLNDVETRYHLSEKLCLCLYLSCTKLKQYVKPIDVYVYSHFGIIKHMLLKLILASNEFDSNKLSIPKLGGARELNGEIFENYVKSFAINNLNGKYSKKYRPLPQETRPISNQFEKKIKIWH